MNAMSRAYRSGRREEVTHLSLRLRAIRGLCEELEPDRTSAATGGGVTVSLLMDPYSPPKPGLLSQVDSFFFGGGGGPRRVTWYLPCLTTSASVRPRFRIV